MYYICMCIHIHTLYILYIYAPPPQRAAAAYRRDRPSMKIYNTNYIYYICACIHVHLYNM